MKINFTSFQDRANVDIVYADLTKYAFRQLDRSALNLNDNILRGPTENLHDLVIGYYDLDLLGEDLVFANENFPAEQYVWYHWFESIFVVPAEMYSFFVIKWS